jgi:hypothetical protein
MSEHVLCPSVETFADAKEQRAFLVLEARRIVLWAGSLVDEGEEIGGIGTQLRRAAERLRLHDGVVWRAYQRRSGPEIFPVIWEARNKLIERLAKQRGSPWQTGIGASPHVSDRGAIRPRVQVPILPITIDVRGYHGRSRRAPIKRRPDDEG